MGPVAPRAVQVMSTEPKPVIAQQLGGALVVESRPLELEEQQLGLVRGGLLLHVLQQRSAGGIGGVGRELQ